MNPRDKVYANIDHDHPFSEEDYKAICRSNVTDKFLALIDFIRKRNNEGFHDEDVPMEIRQTGVIPYFNAKMKLLGLPYKLLQPEYPSRQRSKKLFRMKT